jgi:flagellar biogenesis protein FliO
MIWAIFKMMIALGGLLVVLYLALRIVKRTRGQQALQGGGGINLLASKLIAPQKYVALVEIGSEILALGISPQNITFLTRIPNKEAVRGALGQPGIGPESLAWVKNFSFKGLKSGVFRTAHEK